MLPSTITVLSTPQGESLPSMTYKLDMSGNRIIGMTDNFNATVQAITKILKTEKYTDVIYDGKYGVELQSLVGKSLEYIKADLPRRIKEALSQDDRVVSVVSTTIDRISIDSVSIEIIVSTVFGDVGITLEELL